MHAEEKEGEEEDIEIVPKIESRGLEEEQTQDSKSGSDEGDTGRATGLPEEGVQHGVLGENHQDEEQQRGRTKPTDRGQDRC
jgi:hypothetical protein